MDIDDCDLSQYFRPAAEFIHKAVDHENGNYILQVFRPICSHFRLVDHFSFSLLNPLCAKFRKWLYLHFYLGPVLAFGYCVCLRLSVCVVCVCLCMSALSLSSVQSRTAKSGPEVQNTLVKIPISEGVTPPLYLYLSIKELAGVYWIHYVCLSVCRWHGFRIISRVCFWIQVSNFMCMFLVAMGRNLLISATSLSKWQRGGHIVFFVFWALTLVWLCILTPNISSTLLVCMGRSLLIFSNDIFKMATWRPQWNFWFAESYFILALNINSKFKWHIFVFMSRRLLILSDVRFKIHLVFFGFLALTLVRTLNS